MSKKSNKDNVSSDALKPQEIDQSTDKIRELESQVTTLEQKIEDLERKNLNSLAEIQNLGNRLRRDFDTKLSYAITHFAKDMLDVGDVLSTGLHNCSDEGSEHYTGMKMTLDKFFMILKDHDIEVIQSLDKPFNHEFHEALTSQETDEVEPGTVIQVVQEGYQFKDRVLRPAKVIVSKKVSEKT